MSASKDGISGVSWFWGVVLSLSLHIVIFLMAIFWGFGSPMYSGEPESIEGTLVSISELGQPGGEVATEKEEVKPQVPETKEEPAKVEEKKPEEKIQVSKPEKKEPQEEPKKTELKKEETPKEKPKQDDTIVLQEKEKKKEKKEIAKKPEPTEPPKTKPQKKVESKKETFEDVKNRVIGEMQKQKLLKEFQQKRVASADSSAERKGVQKGAGYSTGGSRGGSSGVVAELFVRRVREEIKNNWAIPENIPIDGSLKAVIVFKLDERGRPSDVKVDIPSGNTAFDDFCVKAIYRASPLTPPPPELLEEARTEGLEVEFTP
ncbi:MAG TPA: cell envelope integrity protein TolA [Thermodesulfobacteriota bacterium]|nr:cell envelope integrity protein TolA [Thermodesulfobacteriota bacterium]